MTKIALLAWEEVNFDVQPTVGEREQLQARQLYTEVGWNFLELENPVAREEMAHEDPVDRELEDLRFKLVKLTITESEGRNDRNELN